MAIIVIDPGHGGTEKVSGSSANNASSLSGLLEQDLTLAVARHAVAALTARGHTVRATRSQDVNLGLAARAAVAKTAQADAFVSIHFNGFGDITVQGTETWVHQNASSRSHELAGCVQRAVLLATGHRNRGVQAKVLGVLDPVHHTARTAACLAELTFITTTAEDARLHDPAYLQALGESVAIGIDDFVSQQAAGLAARAVRAVEPRPEAFRTMVEFTTSTAVSPTAITVTATQEPLPDVRQAIAGLPKKGRKAKFAGPVQSDGDVDSHIQGLAVYKDFFLLTHSDKSKPSGRILVVDRRPGQQKVVTEVRLPLFGTTGPSFNHAGGCQVIGDVLAVPSESGQNASVIAFFDVSDPLDIRELNGALRIHRDARDAAAVGITTFVSNSQRFWLLAAYDSGTVDFYESPDLLGGAPFVPLFSVKIGEKHHQALLLLTDQANRVFAVGLNRTFLGDNDLVLYEVDLVGQSMTPDPDREYSPDGSALRWGAGLAIGPRGLVMHCTNRNYGKSCTINGFDPFAALLARTSTARAASGARATRAARGAPVAKTRTIKGRPSPKKGAQKTAKKTRAAKGRKARKTARSTR